MIKFLLFIIYNFKYNFKGIFSEIIYINNNFIKKILIKIYNLINKIEKYYILIYRVYEFFLKFFPNILKKKQLIFIIKYINNIIKLNKLIFILLIFEIYLKIIKLKKLLITILIKIITIKKEIKKI